MGEALLFNPPILSNEMIGEGRKKKPYLNLFDSMKAVQPYGLSKSARRKAKSTESRMQKLIDRMKKGKWSGTKDAAKLSAARQKEAKYLHSLAEFIERQKALPRAKKAKGVASVRAHKSPTGTSLIFGAKGAPASVEGMSPMEYQEALYYAFPEFAPQISYQELYSFILAHPSWTTGNLIQKQTQASNIARAELAKGQSSVGSFMRLHSAPEKGHRHRLGENPPRRKRSMRNPITSKTKTGLRKYRNIASQLAEAWPSLSAEKKKELGGGVRKGASKIYHGKATASGVDVSSKSKGKGKGKSKAKSESKAKGTAVAKRDKFPQYLLQEDITMREILGRSKGKGKGASTKLGGTWHAKGQHLLLQNPPRLYGQFATWPSRFVFVGNAAVSFGANQVVSPFIVRQTGLGKVVSNRLVMQMAENFSASGDAKKPASVVFKNYVWNKFGIEAVGDAAATSLLFLGAWFGRNTQLANRFVSQNAIMVGGAGSVLLRLANAVMNVKAADEAAKKGTVVDLLAKEVTTNSHIFDTESQKQIAAVYQKMKESKEASASGGSKKTAAAAVTIGDQIIDDWVNVGDWVEVSRAEARQADRDNAVDDYVTESVDNDDVSDQIIDDQIIDDQIIDDQIIDDHIIDDYVTERESGDQQGMDDYVTERKGVDNINDEDVDDEEMDDVDEILHGASFSPMSFGRSQFN